MNNLSSDSTIQAFRCGHVTIVGRPNVGKSTLLNHLLGQKLGITSRKPQTTRWQMLGIKTSANAQIIYIDTPGIQSKHKNALNRHMNREALETLAQVDLVLFVVEAMKWTEADENVARLIMEKEVPILLVVNKVDKITQKEDLLPFIKTLSEQLDGVEMIPVSAKNHTGLEELEQNIIENLPCNAAIYPDDQITDRNERFFAAEFIREKLMRKLGQELPYHLAVTIDEFKEEKTIIKIQATIWVESQNQKQIVVGEKGGVLKTVGEQSRKDMENLFGKKVFLQTWVKVRRKWTENDNLLKQMGYIDSSFS